MQITTAAPNPVTINDFDGLRGIVGKIRKIPVMKDMLREEPSGQVRYNGQSIAVGDRNALEAQIPNVLTNMDRDFFQGKVYAGRPEVYTKSFARHINLLLTWLNSVFIMAGTVPIAITASCLKSALKWISSVQEHLRIDMSNDSVEDIITSL
jgi:hypothetical protein